MKLVIIYVTAVCSLIAGNLQNSFVDKINHLQWEDTVHTEDNNIKWAMAKSYCSSLFLSGYADWRLPTKKELILLVPYVKKGKFSYGTGGSYWTSQEFEEDDLNAWAVYVKTAHTFNDDKCNTASVRCVR